MYARVANIRFSPEMRAEVVRVARGLAPVLRSQRGFKGEHHHLFVGDRSRRGGERGRIFLHWTDEHDVELPLRSPRPNDLRSEREGVSTKPEEGYLSS